jgi:hypothetical protein
MLGEKDWEWIHDWHQREIPTTLIDEAFEELATKLKRRRRPPTNLGVLAPLIEESWRAIQEGRIEPPAPTRPETATDPEPLPEAAAPSTAQRWQEAAEALPTESEIRTLLLELSAKITDGLSPIEAAAQLDDALPGLLPEKIKSQLEAQIDGQLAQYRRRMDASTWQQTYDRAFLRAARQSQGIPVR